MENSKNIFESLSKVEQDVYNFAEYIKKLEKYNDAELVFSLKIINFYKGANCYTLDISDEEGYKLVYCDKFLHFNRYISETQLNILRKNPKFFLSLDSRYFMDNEDAYKFSEEKTNKLLSAATKGLEKMPVSEEKVEIQKNIIAKVNGIKEEVKELKKFNKNI